ncbi:NlpC/P60 family protein [Paenibacillus mesophilus]|nr:NlpC/P60 family protein [Paenibacillus mesophilus]
MFLNSPSAHAATTQDYTSDYGWINDWNHIWNNDWNTGNDNNADSAEPAPAAGTASDTDSGSESSVASNIISKGKQYMGVKYKFGSKTGNTSSFDCSSFTQYLYQLNGISIPRGSIDQSRAGTYVPRSQLKPGDLVFFYSPVHHVAIYIGNGKILHTYGDPGVTITDLDSGWWDEHYTTARRVIQ